MKSPFLDRLAALAVGMGSFLALAATPAAAQSPGDQLPGVHEVLAASVNSGQIPGAVVLVAKNGKIVHFEAMGVDRAAGEAKPLHKDSVFGIASLSKPVTAVAVMILVEQGKISLDDPVSKYIPEFGKDRVVRVLKPGSPPAAFSAMPGALPVRSDFGAAEYDLVPAKREMSVRNLLTHTSGIQIFGVPNEAMPQQGPGSTLATVVPAMARAPLEFQPGERWAYSNGYGFDVLGRVVEVASGESFDKFVQARILDPLAMKDTGFGVRAADMARAVPMPFGNFGIPDRSKLTYFSGAAGLWSTVEDYSHFAQMLAGGGEYRGHRILKPETVKAMASNQIGPFVVSGYPPMGMPAEGVKFGLGMLNVTIPEAAGTRVPAGSFGWDGIGTRRFWAIAGKNGEQVVIVSMVPLVGAVAAPFQRLTEAAAVKALLN